MNETIKNIIVVFVLIGLFLVIGCFAIGGIDDYKDYKKYKEFCSERPNFCYCGDFSCSYKSSYTNGVPSDDVKALCELAKSLNDMEILFDFSCEVE